MAPISHSERELWNALRCANESGRAEAAFELASMLEIRRDFEGAEMLLADITGQGLEPIRAEAWFRLAQVLEGKGESTASELAYARAFELASVEKTPKLMLDLAQRFREAGYPGRAAAIYGDIAREAEGRRTRAIALFRLATMLRGLGRHDRAVELLRTAMALCNDTMAPHVALALAEILPESSEEASRGTPSEAEQLLHLVIEADHPDLSPQAALRLARICQRRGQLQEAYRLCQLVIDSDHPQFQEEAHALQSALLHAELNASQDPGERKLCMPRLPDLPELRPPTLPEPSARPWVALPKTGESRVAKFDQDRKGERAHLARLGLFGSAPHRDLLVCHRDLSRPNPLTPLRALAPSASSALAVFVNLVEGGPSEVRQIAHRRSMNFAVRISLNVEPSHLRGSLYLGAVNEPGEELVELLSRVIESDEFNLLTSIVLVAQREEPFGDLALSSWDSPMSYVCKLDRSASDLNIGDLNMVDDNCSFIGPASCQSRRVFLLSRSWPSRLNPVSVVDGERWCIPRVERRHDLSTCPVRHVESVAAPSRYFADEAVSEVVRNSQP